MLTDLKFLEAGAQWPPVQEAERLELYRTNRALFDGRHSEVFAAQYRRISRVIGNFEDVVSYGVTLNYPRKLSLKTADLLFGEPPRIESGDGSVAGQTAVARIAGADLVNTCYEVAVDASRFGDGLFYICRGEDGAGRIEAAQPSVWFPVVCADNVKRVQCHVLAWDYAEGKQRYLKAQIHYKGSCSEKLMQLNENGVIQGVISERVYSTGLSDFAVVPVPNVSTSDRVFGCDDYTDIDSILSELEVRVAQISRILDIHSSPSMQGPPTAAMQENGRWRVKPGNFFANVSGEKVEYLTWDGQLDAAFRQCELLLSQLYAISEMGASVWGDYKYASGQVPSGSALKRLMLSTISKVSRMRLRFDAGLKKAIMLCSQLGGEGIVRLDNVSITWQDGLPADDYENAQIINLRTGNTQTMSRQVALERFDGMTGAQTAIEIERIDEDAKAEAAVLKPTFSGAKGAGGA